MANDVDFLTFVVYGVFEAPQAPLSQVHCPLPTRRPTHRIFTIQLTSRTRNAMALCRAAFVTQNEVILYLIPDSSTNQLLNLLVGQSSVV